MISPNDFAHWLQGFFELTDADTLTTEQVKMIKEHLGLVFNKVTKYQHELIEDATRALKEIEELDQTKRFEEKTPKQWDESDWTVRFDHQPKYQSNSTGGWIPNIQPTIY